MVKKTTRVLLLAYFAALGVWAVYGLAVSIVHPTARYLAVGE
jgi:hypothetical protein